MLEQPSNSSLTKEKFPSEESNKIHLFLSFSKQSHEGPALNPIKFWSKCKTGHLTVIWDDVRTIKKKLDILKVRCLMLVITSVFHGFPSGLSASGLQWHYSTNNNSSYLGSSPESKFSCCPRLLSLSLVILQRKSHCLINIHLYI